MQRSEERYSQQDREGEGPTRNDLGVPEAADTGRTGALTESEKGKEEVG